VGPLIPYIQVPELPLSFLKYLPLIKDKIDPAHPPTIKPFGTLVAIGVYIGSVVAMRHAKERGHDEKKVSEFVFWVVAGGFLGGHVFDAIFYHPDRLARDPLYILALWEGLSSYGGFLGTALGILAWKAYRKLSVMEYTDVVGSAFPLAWVFGRAGCATVHDHPGRLSDLWFAVRWPMGHSFVGRFDLGLIEMVLTIPLAIAFAVLWKRKPLRPAGFYTGIMCVAYAPVRFGLDFLREEEHDLLGGDPRYGGLTPAQWACFGLLAMGIYFLSLWRKDLALTPDELLAKAHASAGGAAAGEDAGDDDAESTASAATADEAEAAAPVKAKKKTKKKKRAPSAEESAPSDDDAS
jgi:phosphatidylglycerol:prolipoprotein diacylglycerol transferase